MTEQTILHRLEVLEHRVSKHGEEIDCLMRDETRTSVVLDRLDKTVAALDVTVKRLENVPARKWESMASAAIGALVAGLVSYLLLKLGLGV